MKKLKILIIEDDPIISLDMKSLLVSEGHTIVGIASKGTQALDFLVTRVPEFVILDIHLGDQVSGIEIAEVIHSKYEIPYIFLTAFSDDATMSSAQEQAPWGYLVKPFQDRTLLSTITTAWNNYQRIQNSNAVRIEETLSILTKQEKNICRALIKGGSYQQIADELFISLNTLKYHVKNIYRKLSISGRAELISKII